ncbi:hypothetical protein GJ744_008188 [Endocarpon pusillum]|uniref:Hydrophobin n=1 Tax=Endocarpon pusillum TaxID=364733 RepID=A0A8H7AJI1_9EURO|nr:hypothetical protein GJ744_008188 [Endocarpon pusillum]
MLFTTVLLSLISMAAADVSCAPQLAPASCSALATGGALEARGVSCNIVTGVFGALKVLGPAATSFCSSYLGVPSATTTSTTVTPALSTESATVTTTTITTVYAFTGLAKRSVEAPHAQVHDLKARMVPQAMAKFRAEEISSACSCFNITPRSTVTVTSTAPTPVTTQFATLTQTSTFRTCQASGGHCDCSDPGACCHLACSCNGPQGPVSTCL